MKNLAILFFLFIFALTAFGQTPDSTPKKLSRTPKSTAPKLGTETEEFEKAKAISNPTERLAALHAFIKNFPASTEIPRAQGLMTTAQVELGVMKLQAKDTPGGIEFYKLAVQEAPTPVPDEIFSKVLIGLPVSLYTLNERSAAFDIAKLIEEKIGANAGQTLELSKFYLNVEYGTEAIRLAQKAAALAPDSAGAYQVLAAANRLNFRLDDAAAAYSKSLELDTKSVAARLGLAEMKRALGKPDEAIVLYREILAEDAADKAAQSGLTLALFAAGKRAEAETELKRALEADPENARLLTGAAYSYAALGLNEQAVEYAQKAIKIDPRNVWSYIAQARALTAQKKPLEAEKILLAARQYSDFPTLDYELASARLAAGLYREAAETLKRSFKVNNDGLVETYLGNRILADAGSFSELLSLERRVALLEPKSADSEENTNQLKALLAFNQKLEAKEATEADLALAAGEFAAGGDNMRLHRQLFAASRLLQKKTALPKVLDLMQSAIDGVDPALNVASPAAAVLADEIYDSRQYAISQNLVVVVPEIPRPTLSAILRGQIEDLAGRALFEQNNVSQSIVRLKRALSVLPEKSAFSRASAWHLGEALQADGKDQEALDAFIKGYSKDFPEPGKRIVIENLYARVNGNLDGLDEKIGSKPETTVAASETKKTTPDNTDNVKITDPTAIPTPEATPAPIEVKAAPTPAVTPETTPETTVEMKTEPAKLPESVPAIEPAKTPEATPEVTPSPENVETKTSNPEPTPVTPADEEEKSTTPKTDEVNRDEIKPEPVPSPTPAETPVNAAPTTTETEPTPTRAEETKPEEKPTPTTPTEAEPSEEKPVESKSDEPKPVEPKPATANMSVIITDNLSPSSTKAKPEVKKTENKPAATTPNANKSIFEPVVINVGKTGSSAPEKTASKPVPEKTPEKEKPAELTRTPENLAQNTAPEEKPVTENASREPVRKPAVVISDSLKPENKPVEPAQKTVAEPTSIAKTEAELTDRNPVETVKNPRVVVTDLLKPENKPGENPVDDKLLSGENRTRIIITENTGVKPVTEEISGCKIVVSPGSLSLLNGGGSLGVMVGFEGEGDFRRISAVSSSASDVEVQLDPEIGAYANRSFFVIKSVSTKSGVFTVTFEAPCGKKEILVKVY